MAVRARVTKKSHAMPALHLFVLPVALQASFALHSSYPFVLSVRPAFHCTRLTQLCFAFIRLDSRIAGQLRIALASFAFIRLPSTHVRTHVCKHAVHAFTHAGAHACMHACMHAHLHAHMLASMLAHA